MIRRVESKMSQPHQTLEPDLPEAENNDGRLLRSIRSRQQIVRALYDLIGEGDMSPSAARIAELAGVSLRTVFRHFDDVDNLYREMTEIVEAQVKPIMDQPLIGATWRAKLGELLDRRTEVFERIMPYKVAAGLRRFSSPFLMEDHEHFIRIERKSLRGILPQSVTADRVLFSALELATGFQAWRRMRQDQKLCTSDARAVMRMTVEKLLDGK